MTFGPKAYTWAGVGVAVVAAIAAVAAALTIEPTASHAHLAGAPVAAPSPRRATGFTTAALPPAVVISLKGCGATYKGPLVVNQKLRIVNGGTVVRHQIYTGAGAILPTIASKADPKHNWMLWSASGKGVFTLKFTHKGCKTPEKVIATVK